MSNVNFTSSSLLVNAEPRGGGYSPKNLSCNLFLIAEQNEMYHVSAKTNSTLVSSTPVIDY